MQKNYLLFLACCLNLFIGLKAVDNQTKKPLSILFVVSAFPSISQTFVLNQITSLIDRGHDIYVYSQNKEVITGAGLTLDVLYKKICYAAAPAQSQKEFFHNNQFDIIYCHFGPCGLTGRRLQQEYNLSGKLITVFHGYDMSKILKIKGHAYNELLPRLDLALPISNRWRDKLIALGSDPAHTVVHHMGIDTSLFTYKERTPHPELPIRLISAARLVPKKGLEYAIKACAQLKEYYENFQYIIIGSGPLKYTLHQLICDLELQEHVYLIDWQSHEQVQQLLDAAHIMLAPSVTTRFGDQEGIPVALMEAMAMGLPVISTYHSGIPELVEDKVTGLLVPEHDVDALAQAIRHLIEHHKKWLKMGKAASSFVNTHFNSSTLIAKLENLLYSSL